MLLNHKLTALMIQSCVPAYPAFRLDGQFFNLCSLFTQALLNWQLGEAVAATNVMFAWVAVYCTVIQSSVAYQKLKPTIENGATINPRCQFFVVMPFIVLFFNFVVDIRQKNVNHNGFHDLFRRSEKELIIVLLMHSRSAFCNDADSGCFIVGIANKLSMQSEKIKTSLS